MRKKKSLKPSKHGKRKSIKKNFRTFKRSNSQGSFLKRRQKGSKNLKKTTGSPSKPS